MAIVKVENPKRVLNTVYGGTAPLQGKLTAYLIRRGLHAKLEEARLIPAKIQSMHGAEKATALAELQETLRDVTEVEGSTYVWVDAPLSGQGGVYGELEEPSREPSRVVTLSLMDTPREVCEHVDPNTSI